MGRVFGQSVNNQPFAVEVTVDVRIREGDGRVDRTILLSTVMDGLTSNEILLARLDERLLLKVFSLDIYEFVDVVNGILPIC